MTRNRCVFLSFNVSRVLPDMTSHPLFQLKAVNTCTSQWASHQDVVKMLLDTRLIVLLCSCVVWVSPSVNAAPHKRRVDRSVCVRLCWPMAVIQIVCSVVSYIILKLIYQLQLSWYTNRQNTEITFYKPSFVVGDILYLDLGCITWSPVDYYDNVHLIKLWRLKT